MDQKTQRDFEEWSRDEEIATMQQEDFSSLLNDMWSKYKRQKYAEFDAGRAVSDDIERMRDVFKLAADGELTSDEVECRFPDPPSPRKIGKCGLCEGEGKYFSYDAKFKFTYGDRRGEAIVVCDCYDGRQLREAIKDMGKHKPGKKRG